MQTSATFIGRLLADAVARRGWRGIATMLLAIVASGCGRHPRSVAIAPRLTPTSDTLGVRLTMAPAAKLATLPEARASGADGKPIRFVWHHSYGPGLPPEQWPLIVVNGVALGLRADRTIDPVVAQRLFQRVSCRDVVTIEFVKRELATKRFGPGGYRGAFLIVTRTHSSRVRQGEP
jgi:hypothetical protein